MWLHVALVVSVAASISFGYTDPFQSSIVQDVSEDGPPKPKPESYLLSAVVEYSPVVMEDSKATVLANLANYETIVKELKGKFSNLTLVVFPELGLHTVENVLNYDKKNDLYSEPVPDLKKPTPTKSSPVLTKLSNLAKAKNVHLVVNVVEKGKTGNNSQDVLFNTNVVFSPAGAVIARYRKINIFGKSGHPFTAPDEAELSVFTVDGVKFGTFTCFDIMFRKPALELVYNKTVRHFAFPTAWFSELPHLNAIQEQSAWAYATDSVLLAAGYNDPALGSTGSGVFMGNRNGPYAFQVQTKVTYAVVANIPKDPNTKLTQPAKYVEFNLTKKEDAPLKMKRESFKVYNTKSVEEGQSYAHWNASDPLLGNVTVYNSTRFNETICNGELCCHFSGTLTAIYLLDTLYQPFVEKVGGIRGDEFGRNRYTYAVFDGVRAYENVTTGGVQTCSIVSCSGSSIDTCGNRTDQDTPQTVTVGKYEYKRVVTMFDDVHIHANFSTKNTFTTSQILLSSHDTLFFDAPDSKLDIKYYGHNLPVSSYSVDKVNSTTPATYLFSGKTTITNPGSISLYTRVFSKDGNNATKPATGDSTVVKASLFMLILSFVFALA